MARHAKKDVSDKVDYEKDFYIQISMKTCQKMILKFFDGHGQAFLKFPK